MNWTDFAVIALVVFSIVSGVLRGLSRSGFGFLALIVAFLSAAWLYPTNPVRFLILFVALICASAIGEFLLGRWFKSAGLKWLDRLLGGAFGLTNAILLSVFAMLALLAFGPGAARAYAARSAVAPYASEAACTMAEIVPYEMEYRVKQSYAELARLLPARFRKVVRLPRQI